MRVNYSWIQSVNKRSCSLINFEEVFNYLNLMSASEDLYFKFFDTIKMHARVYNMIIKFLAATNIYLIV